VPLMRHGTARREAASPQGRPSHCRLPTGRTRAGRGGRRPECVRCNGPETPRLPATLRRAGTPTQAVEASRCCVRVSSSLSSTSSKENQRTQTPAAGVRGQSGSLLSVREFSRSCEAGQ
jgi:hypothetical protein